MSHIDLWITVSRRSYLDAYGVSIPIGELLKGKEIAALVERNKEQLNISVKPRIVLTPTDPSAEIAVFLKSAEAKRARLMPLCLLSGLTECLLSWM